MKRKHLAALLGSLMLFMMSWAVDAAAQAQSHDYPKGPYNGVNGPLALSDIISSRRIPHRTSTVAGRTEVELCWVARDQNASALYSVCGVPDSRVCGSGALSAGGGESCDPADSRLCMANTNLLAGVNPFAWSATASGSCVRFDVGRSYNGTKMLFTDPIQYLNSVQQNSLPKAGTPIVGGGVSCVLGQTCDLLLGPDGKPTDVQLRVDVGVSQGTPLSLNGQPCNHGVSCQKMLGQPAPVYPLGVYSPGVYSRLLAAERQKDFGSSSWTKLPGSARDIAAGADGSVWVIGMNEVDSDGYGIYRLEDTRWTQWPNSGVHIAVDAGGQPWVVTKSGLVRSWSSHGKSWQGFPGQVATSVAVRSFESIWILGTQGTAVGKDVFRFDGSRWVQSGSGFTRLAVTSKGELWGINALKQILRRTGSTWQYLPGAAVDIAIGGNDVVVVAGTDGNLHRWDGSGWVPGTAAGAVAVAVDGKGVPYMLNKDGEIFRGVPW